MRNFFKDYLELCKDSGKFYEKHWKGVIVLNMVCIVVMFMPYIYDKINKKMLHKWYEKEVAKMNNEEKEES